MKYKCKQIQARGSRECERDENDRHSRVFDREQPMHLCCRSEERPKCRLSSQHKNPQKFLAFSLNKIIHSLDKLATHRFSKIVKACPLNPTFVLVAPTIWVHKTSVYFEPAVLNNEYNWQH